MSDAPVPVSRVYLRDLHLEAHVGYYGHERGVTQPLVVAIEITLQGTTLGRDELAATIDYDTIAGIARDLARTHVDLVETFAERLAERCLALPFAGSVRLRVEKPRSVPGAVAGVEIVRVRPAG